MAASWQFFHAMEKLFADFPRNGKTFRGFSTQWKTCFHGVENPRAAIYGAGGWISV
jgi:hypothetical protein